MEKILILLFILSTNALALVSDFTSFGASVRWSPSLVNIPLRVDASNSSLAESTVFSITQGSANQWNPYSNLDVTPELFSQGPQSGSSDLYFSDNPIFFNGNGVIAVTQVQVDQRSGLIREADIILNKNTIFSTTATGAGLVGQDPYLGDVLTHEIGHLFGLGNEQTKGSSMVSDRFRGQFGLAPVDIHAISSKYGSSSGRGQIAGTVFGGDEFKKIGVFGTYVQLISANTGDVVASAYTNANGGFTIDNLDLNDTYYIATSPISIDSDPPNFYRNAEVNFCTASDYRLSFYGSCFTADRGLPIGIKLTAANPSVTLPAISIGCDIKVPELYRQNKYTSEFDLEVNYGSKGLGSTMIGYFAPDDVQAALADQIRVNFSDVPIPGSNYALEIKILTDALYSNLPLQLNVDNIASGGTINSDFPAALGSLTNGLDWLIKDSESNNKFSITARIPLTSGISVANNFLLTINPIDVAGALGANYNIKNFFPASDRLLATSEFYMLMIRVVENNPGSGYPVYSSRDYFYADNSRCLEGPNTFAVSPFLSGSLSAEKSKRDTLSDGAGIGCGSIDMSGPGSGGSGGFFVGLILSIIIAELKKRKILL